MTILELEKRINSLCTHVLFDYKGHSCGIDPLALDDFDMWCGESYMKAKNIDEVITVADDDLIGAFLKENHFAIL